MNAFMGLRVVASAAVLAMGLLAGCGGDADTSEPIYQPASATAGALVASQPGELLAYVQGKLRERQAQRKLVPDTVFVTATTTEVQFDSVTGAPTTSTGAGRSGTTVQEQGVDEDDLIKSDGTSIYTLLRPWDAVTGKVQLHRRRADGRVDAVGTVDLPTDASDRYYALGMYLAPAAQRLAVLSASQSYYTLDICAPGQDCPAISVTTFAPMATRSQVALDLLNVSNPAAAAVTDSVRIEGRIIGSRLVGNALVLVTQHWPQLALEALPANVPDSEREALIAKLTASDLLPTVRVNGAAAQPLVTDTDCYVQPKNASYGIEITTITVFDLQSPSLQRSSRCFVGGTEALYMAPANLYLATSRYTHETTGAGIRFAPQTSTDVHKFAIDGAKISQAGGLVIDYRGSGEVPGHLGWDPQKNSYRMSEWKGDLRLLSFTGETGWGLMAEDAKTPSPATLTTLRERSADRTLQIVSQLPNAQRPQALGKPGEQVYGVRFLGDRGYVVTFRRVDPLYVLDLSHPSDPKTVGELLIPGFSDYLFPVGDGLLLGVGRDATESGQVSGVKVALFDVADPTQPRQLNAMTFGGAGSSSGLDYSRHGIDLFTRGPLTRVALPLVMANGTWSGWIHGLQRLEVDAGARTLVAKPMIPSASAMNVDLGSDRALQIDDHVYYFNAGQLTATAW
ncbi:MAG: beta-propeller domain-containing protein [Rubrivivax sp.]|nr:beta-propeller domain-containing protein [Rubrivivax sp.]